MLVSRPEAKTHMCCYRNRDRLLHDLLPRDLDLHVCFDKSKLKAIPSTLELWRWQCVVAANNVLVQCRVAVVAPASKQAKQVDLPTPAQSTQALSYGPSFIFAWPVGDGRCTAFLPILRLCSALPCSVPTTILQSSVYVLLD